MSIEAYITTAVILLAFILFATEYFSIDLIAISIIGVLVITGVLSAEDGLKGFANEATLTVAAMYVLSDALLKTGLIDNLTPYFERLLSKGYRWAMLVVITGTGSISAFINNTPVVASMIPIINSASAKSKIPVSKVLIPLSFGAMFGGCCTLIGTSTNLLVSGIAHKNNIEGISMFTMAPLGLIFFAIGTIYLVLVGKKLLPDRKSSLDQDEIQIKNYVTEVKVKEPENDSMVTIDSIFSKEGLEVDVEQLKRGESIIKDPDENQILYAGDYLLIKGDRSKIRKLIDTESLIIAEDHNAHVFKDVPSIMLEIVILPNSKFINQKLSELDFFTRYRAKVMAIRQRGKKRINDLDEVKLQAGDILLLQTTETGHKIIRFAENRLPAPFLSLNEKSLKKVDRWRLFFVIGIIATIITLAATNVLPISIGALAAIAVLVFFKVTTMESAYRAIDWKVIMLLAGALCLGEAMSQSGLSEMVANFLVGNIGEQLGPIAVVSALYLTTSILTEIMSNNAAAALLAPIAISIAGAFGVNPVPFLLSIAFASSASFITPIGYQTNTMVYSAGNYAFTDFVKIGTPLNIIFWIVATFLIPVFYPL